MIQDQFTLTIKIIKNTNIFSTKESDFFITVNNTITSHDTKKKKTNPKINPPKKFVFIFHQNTVIYAFLHKNEISPTTL